MYRSVIVEHKCDDREECDADGGAGTRSRLQAAGYPNGVLCRLITSTIVMMIAHGKQWFNVNLWSHV